MGLLKNDTKLKLDERIGLNELINPKIYIISGNNTSIKTQQFFI